MFTIAISMELFYNPHCLVFGLVRTQLPLSSSIIRLASIAATTTFLLHLSYCFRRGYPTMCNSIPQSRLRLRDQPPHVPRWSRATSVKYSSIWKLNPPRVYVVCFETTNRIGAVAERPVIEINLINRKFSIWHLYGWRLSK